MRHGKDRPRLSSWYNVSGETTMYSVMKKPVGSGKSAVAKTIQSWADGGAVLAPSNIHVKQYLDDFEDMGTVWSQDNYHYTVERGAGPRGGIKYTPTDTKTDSTVTERWYRKNVYQYGPKNGQYKKDLQFCKRQGSALVCNYMTFIAHKLQRKLLIVDEAHQLLATLRSQAATKLWQRDFGYPDSCETLQDVFHWLDTMPDTPTRNTLRNALTDIKPSTTVEFTEEFYRGNPANCIKLSPLDCSEEAPIYWPNKTQKIILMSATIDKIDVDAMGLGDRRILTIDVPSPIPAKNRPVYIVGGESLSRDNLEENLPSAAAYIQTCLEQYPEKGFIHCSYGMAGKLSEILDEPRLMFHTKENKKDVYKSFLQSDPKDGMVMVGSGLHEGIDLKGDIARWQVMLQCPWPSLADAGHKWLAEREQDYYLWACTREVLQASGRVCRGVGDKGMTLLYASEFRRWYDMAKTAGQIPDWFNLEVL
jgi:hypothetical protein